MGNVTIDFESYQHGHLPGVCVLTGVETEDRMTLRTSIVETAAGTKTGGTFLGSLDRFISTLDPRKPRNLLMGHLPVDAGALARRSAIKRAWKTAVWVLVALVVFALGRGAAWAPFVVTMSAAGLVYAGAQLRRLRSDVPRPTVIGAGSKVYLDNVHERFVSAVEDGR